MSEESKELDGNVSTAELLGEVKTAIRKILIGGQSYQIGSRKLTRADLYQLRKLKEELEGYNGTYAIQSFDPRVLWWFRQNCPEVPRGQLMEHFRRHGTKVVPIYDFFASHLLFNFITQPDFISYQYMDRDRLAFRVIKGLYGVQEFSWTVRDEELADFLKKEGSLVIFEGYNNKLDEEE